MNTNPGTSLLNEFANYCKKSEVKLPYNFNILDEQCGHIVENSHTNLLMKLLQYKNQYRNIFLESFFSFIGLVIPIDLNKDVKFYREKSYAGEKEKGRLDGLIYQKDIFVLIIENKVNGAGNQKEQLKKYIEGVIKDNDIFSSNDVDNNKEKIWVMFLTKNGVEKPDEESWQEMCKRGICEDGGYNENDIHGSRYVAINYQEHILPWLKEEIQPIVMQKEQVLNTGLLQYIDFLEGMLGVRQSDTELLKKGKGFLVDWLKRNKNLEIDKNPDFKKINDCLDDIKKNVDNQLKKMIKGGGEDIVDYRRYAGLLNNLLEEINDEPMKDFFEITRNYFESNGFRTKCVISHIFNYYYIQIRDVSWPRSVHFEWYPLGVKKLTNSKQKEFTFCFHVENAQIRQKFQNDEIKKCFENRGFVEGKHSRTLTFTKTFNIKDMGINENPFIPKRDNKDGLNEFLGKVYDNVPEEMIEQINKILKEN